MVVDPERAENILSNDGTTMRILAQSMGKPSAWSRQKEIVSSETDRDLVSAAKGGELPSTSDMTEIADAKPIEKVSLAGLAEQKGQSSSPKAKKREAQTAESEEMEQQLMMLKTRNRLLNRMTMPTATQNQKLRMSRLARPLLRKKRVRQMSQMEFKYIARPKMTKMIRENLAPSRRLLLR